MGLTWRRLARATVRPSTETRSRTFAVASASNASAAAVAALDAEGFAVALVPRQQRAEIAQIRRRRNAWRQPSFDLDFGGGKSLT